jgi:hypothetical protein
MGWADNFFNQLAKHSAFYIVEGKQKAAAFTGQEVNYGMVPREFADRDKLARLFAVRGFAIESLPDKRIRVKGDLAALAQAALREADLFYRNDTASIEAAYGFRAAEAIYCWWLVFDGLTRRYTQDGMGAEADFARFMTTRVLEPAYNFRGIEARPIDTSIMPVFLLLAAYIVFTVWYGFSVLLMFEGLAITAQGGGKKAEA